MDDMQGRTVFRHRLAAAPPALTLRVPGAEGLAEALLISKPEDQLSQNHLENTFGDTRGSITVQWKKLHSQSLVSLASAPFLTLGK